MDSISSRFKKLIKRLGTQKEIAGEIGVSVPAMIRYGREGDTLPSTEVLLKLHELYKVNVHWLLTGNGSMFIKGDKPKPTIQDIYPGIPNDDLTQEILAAMQDEYVLMSLKMEYLNVKRSRLSKESIQEKKGGDKDGS
jgi:transcriptional regulator with XRE-family HTH domain